MQTIHPSQGWHQLLHGPYIEVFAQRRVSSPNRALPCLFPSNQGWGWWKCTTSQEHSTPKPSKHNDDKKNTCDEASSIHPQTTSKEKRKHTILPSQLSALQYSKLMTQRTMKMEVWGSSTPKPNQHGSMTMLYWAPARRKRSQSCHHPRKRKGRKEPNCVRKWLFLKMLKRTLRQCWVSALSNWQLYLLTFKLDCLISTWNSPVYAIFEPRPMISSHADHQCLEFKCGAPQCKGDQRECQIVRQYLDPKASKDGKVKVNSSTGNLFKHAKKCWGKSVVEQAVQANDLATTSAGLQTSKVLADGSITATFERTGKEKVTFSIKLLIYPKTRWADIISIVKGLQLTHLWIE